MLVDDNTITTGLHERSIIEYGDGTLLPVETARRHACAVGECDRGFGHCEIHHLLGWDQHHGPTDLDNLIPVCGFHHRAHEGRRRL